MDQNVLTKIRSNNHRAISKTISSIERGDQLPSRFLSGVHTHCQQTIRIGITGPPGAGKSTLVDKLIHALRKEQKTVGVIAVDPTSPFTGGSLLGDRVRMNRFFGDPGVFIRSMGSHGDLGGLARKAQDAGDIIAASGKDYLLFETVGVGQGEHDIVKAVDITIVVLVPESGDEIQLMKAGLIEIANIFVINKSDREGANRLSKSLNNVLNVYSTHYESIPPIISTVATSNTGISDLLSEIKILHRSMDKDGSLNSTRLEKHRKRIALIIQEKLLEKFWTGERINELAETTKTIDSIKLSPNIIAQKMLGLNE